MWKVINFEVIVYKKVVCKYETNMKKKWYWRLGRAETLASFHIVLK